MKRGTWTLLAAVLVAATAAADPWQVASCPYRVPVTVEASPAPRLPGDEIGVATVYAAGTLAPDAADVRVAAAAGELTACRVLQVGPGDLLRVAFALRPGATRYYVYFGDPRATAPAEALSIRRGLLMETRAHRGGRVQTADDVRAAFDRAAPVLGCDFRENLFIGHNPFGPQTSLCSRFTGYLDIPRAGRYTLICSSRDASFVWVDGKRVIDNGGLHSPQRDCSRQAVLTLTAGLHEVEMLHAAVRPPPIAVLAWLPEGRPPARPVPPALFAPVARAAAGPLQHRDRTAAADIAVQYGGEAWIGPTLTLHRVTFRRRFAEQGAAASDVRWDFGDGQTAAGSPVEHVFLREGTYRVVLTARCGGQELSRTLRLHVGPDYDQPRRQGEAPAQYGRIVGGYDAEAMDDDSLVAAALLFEELGQVQRVLDLTDVLVGRPRADAAAVGRLARMACAIHRRQGRTDEAVALLTAAAERTGNGLVRAALQTLLGEALLEDRHDDRAALAVFEQVLASPAVAAIPVTGRGAWIGAGDVWRARGDYARARAAYEQAMLTLGDPAGEAVRRGAMARDVEALLRDGDYDGAGAKLADWEQQLPVDRLDGQTALLWVRVHQGRREWARVITRAEGLVAVHPADRYAPALLLHAADAHLKCGQPLAARDVLRRLAQGYPESALAQEARSRLGGR
ncbi:MAG: PKD domain-containing protein [Planctomycetes bacterium]|nr:PKD domain-containing protein [Planctomycetota bacterium]